MSNNPLSYIFSLFFLYRLYINSITNHNGFHPPGHPSKAQKVSINNVYPNTKQKNIPKIVPAKNDEIES